MELDFIATDLDGTLLNPQGLVDAGTVAAIRQVQQKGLPFVVCTGRYPENVAIMLKDAGLSLPIIGLNGSMIDEDGARIYREPMTESVNRRIFEALETVGASYYMFLDRRIVTRREGVEHHSKVMYGDRLTLEYGMEFVYGLKEAEAASRRKAFKYYVYEDERSCTLQQAMDALKNVPDIDLTTSSARNFEIMPRGVNKASGLAAYCAMKGYSRDKLMVFGDYDNDKEMFAYAKYPVAMGNATQDIKNLAWQVTAGNGEGGVEAALKKYVL